MNDNDEHLSLGNLFRIIKELSKNKFSALQSEIFCSLFDVDNINENSAKDIIATYDSEVIVYCKSGNRSSQAKEILENLGYTNVYDLGAISNWKE